MIYIKNQHIKPTRLIVTLLPTNVARIGPVPVVNPHVDSVGSLVGVGAGAEVAFVGFLSRVDSHV